MKETLLLLVVLSAFAASGYARTVVSIDGNRFLINGRPTYAGRPKWKGAPIEGLLFNARMVQGIFDDLNPDTRDQFRYPDTKTWDADRNTREFVAAMKSWRDHGLVAFTLNMQGGSPMGYGNKGWINSAFEPSGELRPAYMKRLKLILDRADRLGMVVILGYFYFGQDQHLTDKKAVVAGVDNITAWLLENGYRNVVVELNNECDGSYDHDILRPARVHELIERVRGTRRKGRSLLAGTSYRGNVVPKPNVVRASDFILLHGNDVGDPARIGAMIDETVRTDGYRGQPIVFNEDDHFEFDRESNNFAAAVRGYASWGYFDYRMKGEPYEDGFQSVPVDWTISSPRKKAFFAKLAEITGARPRR